MPYRRREERDRERARRAAATAQAGGQSALDVALTEIGAAFDQAAAVNGFKIRVERLMRRGPRHPALRARFGARAARLHGGDLDAAIATVERWWRDERKAFQIASALGGGTRLSLRGFTRAAPHSPLDAFQANGGRVFRDYCSAVRSTGRVGGRVNGAPLTGVRA